jgi:hypothetical protein
MRKHTKYLIVVLVCLTGTACSDPGSASNESRYWSRVEPSQSPAARHDANLISVPGAGGFYLFGGRDLSGCRDDLWFFESKTGQWKAIATDEGPSARSGAGLAYDDKSKRLILYGGYCHDRLGQTHFHNELWFFELDSGWSREFTKQGPGKRAWHTMQVRDGRLLLAGGSAPAPDYYMGDLWALDLESLEWDRLVDAGGPLTSGRMLMLTASGEKKNIQLFGRTGVPTPERLGIWSHALGEKGWKEIDLSADSEDRPMFDFHQVLLDSAGTIAVIRGPVEAGEVWQIWSRPAGAAGHWTHHSDSIQPTSPIGMACAAEGRRTGQWLCFGGSLRSELSDQTWRLTLGKAADGKGDRK